MRKITICVAWRRHFIHVVNSLNKQAVSAVCVPGRWVYMQTAGNPLYSEEGFTWWVLKSSPALTCCVPGAIVGALIYCLGELSQPPWESGGWG